MFAPPAVAGDITYAFSCSGRVFAAGSGRGDVQWAIDLDTLTPGAEIHGQPAIVGDQLFVPVDSARGGAVYAISRSNGTVLWRETTPLARERGFSTDVLASGTSIVTISAGHELVAFEQATGKRKWLVPLLDGSTRAERRHSAAVADGRVYCTAGSDLLIVAAADGRILHRIPLGAAASSSVAVHRDRIYVGLADKTLRTFDRDGRQLSRAVLPDAALTPAVISGNVAVVLTSGDEVVGVSRTATIWRLPAEGEWTSPRLLVAGGAVVAGNGGGDVVMIRARDGAVLDRLRVPDVVRGIAAGANGFVIGTLSGDVYAIRQRK